MRLEQVTAKKNKPIYKEIGKSMPKITIKEVDKTTSASGSYSSFAVVVPGFVSATKSNIFDENGVAEISDQDVFEKEIGKEAQGETGTLGNQIAYELLGLGYTVLFKKMDNIADIDDYNKFWAALEDKANYDFRYICTGLIKNNADANKAICKLASTRGDCIALLDIADSVYDTGKTQSANITAIVSDISTNFSDANKYSAIFAPTVTYDRAKDKVYQNNTLPGSFHYLVCAAEAFESYAEWFAVAGYTRGVSSEYKVLSTEVKFGEAAINALEPRYTDTTSPAKAVNLIVKIKNAYYLWGNRTAHALETVDATAGTGDLKASHFLNIRQLCTTLKKQLYVNCRRFTFDPNSDVLWINFVNAIEPLLQKMQANQGIEDYQIIKVKSSQKAKFGAIIRIVPIEAVEDFDLTITLEDSISGTSVTVVEEKEDSSTSTSETVSE